MKIGIGQDSHRFETNTLGLVLGGIKFDNFPKLKGNSDGDALIHSLCNALSSAIGGESLSTWSDNMCLKQGITDSREYLKHIFNFISEKFNIGNISLSIEAQIPRFTPEEKLSIKKSLAEILKINLDQIGITYTSGEDLTAFGRKEGIQVFSTVLLEEK